MAIAEENAAGARVVRVDLRVGHLRQVVPSALEFGFRLASEGTPVEGAELVIESVPAEGRCRDCGHLSALSRFPFVCERCAGPDLEITNGEQLSVESIEVERIRPDDRIQPMVEGS